MFAESIIIVHYITPKKYMCVSGFCLEKVGYGRSALIFYFILIFYMYFCHFSVFFQYFAQISRSKNLGRVGKSETYILLFWPYHKYLPAGMKLSITVLRGPFMYNSPTRIPAR